MAGRPETAYVRSNGQVTLPVHVRRAAEPQEGDVVEVVLRDGGTWTPRSAARTAKTWVVDGVLGQAALHRRPRLRPASRRRDLDVEALVAEEARVVRDVQPQGERAPVLDNEAALHAYRTLGNLRVTWDKPRPLTRVADPEQATPRWLAVAPRSPGRPDMAVLDEVRGPSTFR